MEHEQAVLDWIDFHWWKLSNIINVDIVFTGENAWVIRMPNFERWQNAPQERTNMEYECLMATGRIL
jgi:hypothetical protein